VNYIDDNCAQNFQFKTVSKGDIAHTTQLKMQTLKLAFMSAVHRHNVNVTAPFYVCCFCVINVKKTTVYTHNKKLYYYITAHRRTSMCSSIVK